MMVFVIACLRGLLISRLNIRGIVFVTGLGVEVVDLTLALTFSCRNDFVLLFGADIWCFE